MSDSNHNEGIIVQGGTINAGNLGVGRGVRVVSYATPEVAAPAPSVTPPVQASPDSDPQTAEWDAFISHAHEDKREFVAALATRLRDSGLKIWYDDFLLAVGKSLRESIDLGLVKSRYGIVVLSRSYFSKDWTHQEVNGLMSRETNGKRVILPVWHKVTREEVRQFSPILADRLAVDSSEGLETVTAKLLQVLRPGT
jgi:hypothetical protein